MPKKKATPRVRTKQGEIPKIHHRKDRNLAYILLGGTKKYLGHYDGVTISPEVEAERLRVWNESRVKRGLDPQVVDGTPVTVTILVNRFLEEAKTTYVKHGRSTGSYERFVIVVRPLFELYPDSPADSFSPSCLKAVRERMVTGGLARKTVNDRINLIRQIFRWGVSNELVEVDTWAKLKAVEPLLEGKTKAPDHPDIEPVDPKIVEATLPFMPPAVAAMVCIQQLNGARPSEICNMRPCDIFREGDTFPKRYAHLKTGLQGIWVYIPSEHKLEHKKKDRWLPLGPKCQEIILSYLGVDPDWQSEEYIFSPEAEQRIRAAMARANRKTPVQPSQLDRRKEEPKRKPGKRYRVDSYRTAIQRAVEKHNRNAIAASVREGREAVLLPKWFPYQLRHGVGTEARATGDLETAQALLGHSNLKTTEIYAKKNKALVVEYALKNG